MADKKAKKVNFAGLMNVHDDGSTTHYEEAKQKGAGKLIFADISAGSRKGKYIYANGIEYNIADASDLRGDLKTINTSVNWLESSTLKNVKVGATGLTEEENSGAKVTLEGSTYQGTTFNSSFTIVSGDTSYVTVGVSNDTITLSAATVSMANAAENNTGLADAWDVKDYVDDLIENLEGALVFKGGVNTSVGQGDNVLPAIADTSKGDVYVATGKFIIGAIGEKVITAESGDLLISGGPKGNWVVVERNLDGAVTAADTLNTSHLVIGKGNQSVATISVTEDQLNDAIANANNAIQYIVANSSSADYLDASAAVSSSTGTITIGVKVQDLSTADADHKGLAKAEDVRQRLEEVEYVITTANTVMASTLGLNPSFGVNWSEESGIESGTSYKAAIEGAYEEAHKASVTSFGGKTGAISVADNVNVNGDVSFGFSENTSTLIGKVVGWSALESSVNTLENTSYVNTIKGDSYVKVNSETGVAHDGIIDLSTKLGDISTATEDASGLATAHDVSAFVNYVLQWTVVESDTDEF